MKLAPLLICWFLLGVSAPPSPVAPQPPLTQQQIYEQTMTVVKEHLVALGGGPANPDELIAAGRRELGRQPDDARLEGVVRGVLGQVPGLRGSFLTVRDQEYWALLSAFSGHLEGGRLPQVGAWFERRGSRWFVRNVWAGSPAASAGLLRGDEIVAAQDQSLEPVGSFQNSKPGGESVAVALKVRRVAGGPVQTLTLKPFVESYQASMLRHLRQGTSIRKVRGVPVAYVPLPAATHDAFRDTLTQMARRAQAEAKVLVLDLRDDFGGADLTYLEPFFGKNAVYKKPLVLLVNAGTSGGREWLAWLVKKKQRGVLVGETTAGAFLAGRLHDIVPQRYALYLPVAGSQGTAAELPREGQGVEPDVVEKAALVYAGGQDPVLSKGIEVAVGLAK